MALLAEERLEVVARNDLFFLLIGGIGVGVREERMGLGVGLVNQRLW